MGLAARGARESEEGVERVVELGERRRDRRRAAGVVLETTVVAALLAALILALAG